MDARDEIYEGLLVELKRGNLVLIALSQLDTPEYGYSLVEKLEKKNVPIEAGTLYPLLRRLEKQGLLHSEWDTTESRPRKFYKITEDGKEIYNRLIKEWRSATAVMDNLLNEGE